VDRRPTDLQPVLTHVVSELQARWPDQIIDVSFALPNRIDCDAIRIGQLLSNLLGNALTHGAANAPVRVEAVEAAGRFDLLVTNHGEPIPPQALDRLFRPFERGSVGAGQQGLGLGLYIAGEVARAHAGELTVSSSREATIFKFSMPTV
jgi:sigma-B regulation protein RsbU (phosphoserine phosphatase)